MRELTYKLWLRWTEQQESRGSSLIFISGGNSGSLSDLSDINTQIKVAVRGQGGRNLNNEMPSFFMS